MAKRLILVGGVLVLVLAGGLFALAHLHESLDVSQRPEQSVTAATAAEVPVSYASIIVSLSIAELRRMVNENLSEQVFAKTAKIPKRDIQITVEKNGPFAIWVKGDNLHLRMPIKFKMRGDLRTKGKLTIFSRAHFAIDGDWQPKVKVKTSFEWDRQPRVGIWPFRFRIGDKLSPYIQKALDQASEDLRTRAEGSVHMRELAETGWRRLHEPRQLGTEPAVWLYMQPENFYLEPITSDADDVHLTIWLASRMSLTEGAQPAVAAEVPPLPLLNQGLPPEKSFAIPYVRRTSYTELAGHLNEMLGGKPLAAGGGSIVPTAFEIYPAGAELVLRMTYEGHAPSWWQSPHGVIYFVGKPEYDAQTHQLKLQDFHMTSPTSNPAGFLSRWAMDEGTLPAAVAGAAVWDMSTAVEKARTDTATYLNRTVVNGFDLWGTVTAFEEQGATPGAEGLDLHYLAKGDMSILFVP